MQVIEHCSLKKKHTFHIDAEARYWVDFDSREDLCNVLLDNRFLGMSMLSVGGGSNLLFTRDFPGFLLHSNIRTIELIDEDAQSVLVRVGSGVVWDDFVAYAVDKDWSGVENLSGIPGEVGASPVQNIGAYGSEAKDTIEIVEALNLETLQMDRFSKSDCQFAYRNSIFKNSLKNRFIVCYVTYRLSKILNANIQYGDLAIRVQEKGAVSLQNIRQSILEIRGEKLPDPAVTGNAGSFFMNPEVPVEQYRALKANWPQMPGWPQENGKVKISAAWCIDQAGWKGKSLGNAAVHGRQALVLVNPGTATAADIVALSDRIMDDVKSMFDIDLHPEVLFI
ncbi:MAG: UDP-N-acetylmuramate dehydrogenase [Bacteroidales bacterium]|nr:UDP-N-acetylmuramate dehydrogenase [Bacteroidales bacterium]